MNRRIRVYSRIPTRCYTWFW